MGLARDARGSLHVHRAKRRVCALDVEAHRIYRAARAGKRRSERALVQNIGPDRLQPLIGNRGSGAFGMARRDADRVAMIAQAANDPPAEKSGTAEDADQVIAQRGHSAGNVGSAARAGGRRLDGLSRHDVAAGLLGHDFP